MFGPHGLGDMTRLVLVVVIVIAPNVFLVEDSFADGRGYELISSEERRKAGRGNAGLTRGALALLNLD